jgi:hypothetical protein
VEARGVNKDDLSGKGDPMTSENFAELCYAAKNVVSI